MRLKVCSFVAAELLLSLACAGSAFAQPPAHPRSVDAQDSTGTQMFSPGRWSAVGLRASNQTNDAAQLRATVYFADDEYSQYARDLWLPPNSRRRSWCPIYVPENFSRGIADVRAVGDDRTGPSEVRLTLPEGRRWAASQAPVADSTMESVVITGGPSEPVDEEVRQALLAMRRSRNLKEYVPPLYGDFLPATAEGLAAVGQMVICGDRPAQDAAGRAALRDWVRRGGRLWILLDRVQPETVESLLGDAFGYEVVDRVSLTSIEIESFTQAGESLIVDDSRDFDQPVDHVRALVSDVEVIHAINGWPASFKLPLGRGHVLFTTLGPRGWIQRPPRTPRGSQGGDGPEFIATQALSALGAEFFPTTAPAQPSPDVLMPILTDRVGYRILGRGAVLGILATFCGAVLVCGVWLARRQRLERLGWIGPAAAALVAVVLVLLGVQARRSVPPTIAQVQLANIDPRSEEIEVSGLAAIYRPEPGEIVPQAIEGGFLWPDKAGLEDKIHRLVWSDLDACHWEPLALPGGVRFAEFRRTLRVEAPVAARGGFGPGGLTGRLTGPFTGLDDAVLLGPSGENMAVRFAGDGDFTAAAGDELPPGKFIAAGLLSDEQRRRQTIYTQELPPSDPPHEKPRLAFWSQPLPLGFQLPDGMHQSGEALTTVEIDVERLSPGTQAAIPSPLVVYRSVQVGEKTLAPAYNNTTRQWVLLQFPSETWLRFQLPQEVLPFDPERAVLTLQIDAPSRPVELFARDASGPVLVESWTGPHGKLRVEIDKREHLRPDEKGGILLGIAVRLETSSSQPDPTVVHGGPPWKIDSVALEVAGQSALPPAAK